MVTNHPWFAPPLSDTLRAAPVTQHLARALSVRRPGNRVCGVPKPFKQHLTKALSVRRLEARCPFSASRYGRQTSPGARSAQPRKNGEISNGRHFEWEKFRMGEMSNGRDFKWERFRMGEISNGGDFELEPFRMESPLRQKVLVQRSFVVGHSRLGTSGNTSFIGTRLWCKGALSSVTPVLGTS